MAIETAQRNETQTKLVEESHEERLTRLFEMEKDIRSRKVERQGHVDSANALKNAIKKMESDKDELLNLLDRGQTTFITVQAPQDDEVDAEDHNPSEYELEAFADAEEQSDIEPLDDEGESTDESEGSETEDEEEIEVSQDSDEDGDEAASEELAVDSEESEDE